MTDQQPEALRLAAENEVGAHGYPAGTIGHQLHMDTAAELRRLHAALATCRENFRKHEEDTLKMAQADDEERATLRTRVAELKSQLAAIGAGGVGPLKRWSPPPSAEAVIQMARDAAALGNIESPFNACMHQEHCKRWKAQASAAPQPPTTEKSSAVQSQGERAQQVAAQKDAVFEASIDFIGTLTGMKPPPIETAPPEIFEPFRDFTERVCSIFSDAWQPQREPLTDEQKRDIARYYVISPEMVEAIYNDCNDAIERAHGIGRAGDAA